MMTSLPGVVGEFLADREALEAEWQKRADGYRPRTRHLDGNGAPLYTNRLFFESSPYLLQHAHNPVNWFPWGEQAFELAKKHNKAVLLSVGYSTCHWCHVMEEESFEDAEIAAAINQHFIAVKVDREERPDVDAIYMSAVQLISGHGGWPMTVFMTPQKVPFFAGTYFPARDGDRGARFGFLSLLGAIAAEYEKEPEKLLESAEQLKQALQQMLELKQSTDAKIPKELEQKAFAELEERYDPKYGGLLPAPKFPSSLPVAFLLSYAKRHPDSEALQMALHTLRCMAKGGLHDHVGGGFHRYSTDRIWLVPHFEKMLYDNALLAQSYLRGYEQSADPRLLDVLRDILDYVSRDMCSPEAAFYSATDADSIVPDGTKQEGWFFTWTPEELDSVLDPDDAVLCKRIYGVDVEGNFEGRSILFEKESIGDVAQELSVSVEQLKQRLTAIREKLRLERAKRSAPLLDDKILLSWNALMISAYAQAAKALDDASYKKIALDAMDFILTTMQKGEGFSRSYRQGKLGPSAYLDDYACLIAALLDLFDLTSDLEFLRKAFALESYVAAHFEDTEHGAFFMTAHEQESLIARNKAFMDGAEPSGNTVMAKNLLRLYAFGLRDEHYQRLERLLTCIAGRMQNVPSAFCELLETARTMQDGVSQLLVVVKDSASDASAFVQRDSVTAAMPTVLLTIEESKLADYAELLPWVEAKLCKEGKVTAYLCKQGQCGLPVTSPDELKQQLNLISKHLF
ncbi:MAG: thioredoxin domain-containing protein [Myxococcales bacterium]|nr:MAG: thioredoxin domain-containing protein [Myxococcales bacterium]